MQMLEKHGAKCFKMAGCEAQAVYWWMFQGALQLECAAGGCVNVLGWAPWIPEDCCKNAYSLEFSVGPSTGFGWSGERGEDRGLPGHLRTSTMTPTMPRVRCASRVGLLMSWRIRTTSKVGCKSLERMLSSHGTWNRKDRRVESQDSSNKNCANVSFLPQDFWHCRAETCRDWFCFVWRPQILTEVLQVWIFMKFLPWVLSLKFALDLCRFGLTPPPIRVLCFLSLRP